MHRSRVGAARWEILYIQRETAACVYYCQLSKRPRANKASRRWEAFEREFERNIKHFLMHFVFVSTLQNLSDGRRRPEKRGWEDPHFMAVRKII